MQSGEENRARWICGALAKYEGPLLRYAVRLTGGDLEYARDAVQDTFIRLCAANRRKIENGLAPWLFKVCRNRALEVLRRDRRLSPLSDAQLARQEDGAPDPAAVAERRDDAEAMLQILTTLPEKQQEVIRLRFQNGMTYREISDVADVSVSNVGYLLHTAVRTMRRRLQREAPPEGRPEP